MALDLLDYHRGVANMKLEVDVHEAASAGLDGMQRLMHLLSQQHRPPQTEECSTIAGATINEFRKLVSLLGRSGHARFRRGPQSASTSKHSGFSETLMESPPSYSSEGGPSDSDSGQGGNTTLFRPQPISAVATQASKPFPAFGPSSLSNETPNASPNTAFSPVVAYTSLQQPNSVLPVLPLQPGKPEMQTVGELGKPLSHTLRFCNNLPQSIFAEGAPFNGGPAHTQSFIPNSQNKASHDIQTLYSSDGTIFTMSPQQFFFQPPTIFPTNGAFEKVGKPQPPPSVTQSPHSTPQAPAHKMEVSTSSCPPPFSSATTSFMSSLSLDGSVTNGNQHALHSACIHGGNNGRPPVSAMKKKCSGKSEDAGAKCSSSGKCHCSKRRKSRNRIVRMVPAVSLKMADIPTDEYSWRKYGQKPIKGSPHPRGYYKCSTVRGCPARKHVERSLEDPSMLVVTYEGEHSHPQPVNEVVQG